MADWRESIKDRDSLLKIAEFRNGIHAIPASGIAGQYFCEMKVELSYIHGDIETEQKSTGKELHDKMLPMQKTTLENLVTKIESMPLYGASFGLIAKYDDIVVTGIPDIIIFQNGKPVFVIELKTTRGRIDHVYEDQKAQAQLYCFMLDLMGFDCSNLQAVVVKIQSDTSLSNKQKGDFLRVLVPALFSRKEETISDKIKEPLNIHRMPYHKGFVTAIIEKMKGYWLSQRKPVPTTNPNKCRSCEYNNTCTSSLV